MFSFLKSEKIAGTVAVDGSGDWSSLEEAINSGAKMVTVMAGVYLEKNPIMLTEDTCITGQGKVILEFHEGLHFGIVANQSSGIQLKNLVIRGAGLHLYHCKNAKLKSLIVRDSKEHGIVMIDCDTVSVRDTVCTQNEGNGMLLHNCSQITAFTSSFDNNNLNGVRVEADKDCDTNEFHHCRFELNKFFGLIAEKQAVRVSHCSFESNHLEGLHFTATLAGHVSDCEFVDNQQGIVGANNTLITGCRFINHNTAICLLDHCLCQGNMFHANEVDIDIKMGKRNKVYANICSKPHGGTIRNSGDENIIQ